MVDDIEKSKPTYYVVTGNNKPVNGEWHTNAWSAHQSAELGSKTGLEGGSLWGGKVWIRDEHGNTIAVYERGIRID